jgi:hypothetical protein
MSAPRRKPAIFWEIVDNPPVTDRWQRHVLLVLAKRQSEQGAAVALLPEELVRTGFSLSQVHKALHRLVEDGHIWETRPGYFWVKRPSRQNRWLWERRGENRRA